MSLSLEYEIYYIELWHIFSVLFIVTVNFYIYLHARKNPLLFSYLAVQGLLLIWLVSKIFKTVSPNPDIRWFFIVTQYFGNCFLGSTFFAFAYTYAKGHLPRIKLLLITGMPSLFFFLCMATNPLHMLFYSYYDFYRDSFGPLFYIHQVYSYTLMLIGIYFCAKQFFIEYRHKRIQAAVISTAVIIPLLVNIFYILRLYKALFGFRPLFDVTPIACNLSLLLFAIATFKFRFFDIAVIAWRTVFNQIAEGVLLFSKKKNITELNRSAAVTQETDEIIQAVMERAVVDMPLAFLHKASTGKHFRVSWSLLSGRYRNKGYMLRFIDDTLYQQALESLANKNQILNHINRSLSEKASTKQALAVYKTRNYIGREVHDILGHSIVLALSVLEVARICFKNDLVMAQEKLVQAVTVIKKAKEQMDKDLLDSLGDTASHNNSLITGLERLVTETNLAGQNVNLTIQGSKIEPPKHIRDAVIRLCQEAVTNAVRHGKAEKINIILRLLRTHLEIYIFDNGIGCSEIKKGFGLSGMEERIVSDLKGKINFGSLEGGFTISAVVPLKSD